MKLYLPNGPDLDRMNRQWCINIVYSVCGSPFKSWVQGTIDERNAKVEDKRNLMIDFDPEIAAAFRNSTQVSSK